VRLYVLTAKAPRPGAFVEKPGEDLRNTRYDPSRELDDLAHKVIGAAIEVHRALGPDYLESIYEEALCIECNLQKFPFERQVKIAVDYKDHNIGEGRIDMLLAGILPVELKAVESLAPIHDAQLLSYLKMMQLQLDLLINFNVPVLKHSFKRNILSRK
jgi:GxxExxY protein